MKLHWSIPVVTAGAIIGTALYFSVPANADTGQDAAYLTALAQGGISSVGGGADLIQVGHGLCTMRANGYTEQQVFNFVYVQSRLDSSESWYLIGAAEAAYCRQYLTGGPSASTGSVI